jgi:hypothetical protein
MPSRLLLAFAAALVLVRLPSLTQPMGPDQGLYAYVGDRILHGELAYRDAWDQKPPGIHYVYAGLRAVSRSDGMVAAAELAAAVLTAALLWIVGARLGGQTGGGLAAVLFLLLSDPSLDRYGGVRVRAQAETFIALAVAGAVALALGAGRAGGAAGAEAAGAGGAGGAEAAGAPGARRTLRLGAAGLLVGAAFTLKYNAALYGLVVLAALALGGTISVADVAIVSAAALVVPLITLSIFWRGGALDDLYRSTITYNVLYSGQTYASRLAMLRYLLLFPIHHARVSPLWFVGGLGCLAVLVAGIRRRALWIPLAWVAAACLSIAINGSRELPQYFVQASPALALAAGLGFAVALGPAPTAARWVVALAVAYGSWRAGSEPFPRKLAVNVWHDTEYVMGRVDRRTHLARFGGARDVDKYSALDNIDIGWFLAQNTRPDETVYVFGFSPGSYAYANRRSASRFFWSRPVILDFNHEDPRWGVAGLHADLDRSRPAFVVLQQHDWAPDVQDSAPFFLSQPALGGWLRANYHEIRPFVDGFTAWERNGR